MPIRYRKFGPRLTISLTDGDYGHLHSLAERDEVSVSWVIRRAIEEYLRSHPPQPGRGRSSGRTAQSLERVS
jgi:hypothetical protein